MISRETTATVARSLGRAFLLPTSTHLPTYPPPTYPPPTHLPASTCLPTYPPSPTYLSQGSRGTELDKDFTKLETERRAKTKTAPKQADRNPMSVQVRSKYM